MITKKKLAILVAGEFREFEKAYLSWSFLDMDNDFFISTWDTSIEQNSKLNINIKESVTSDRILKYIPHAIINIEPDTTNSNNSIKQRYHWRKVFEMADNTGVEYDNVIVIRPDLKIVQKRDFNSFINNINNSFIYAITGIVIQPPPSFVYINDFIFLGKYDVVKDAILSLPKFDISKYFIHYHIAKHFVNNDIYVESLYNIISALVMRSSHRDKLYLPIEDQFRIETEWFDAKNSN